MAAWIQLLPALQLFRHKTEGQLSVQVSSTSPSLAPRFCPTSCTSMCVPALVFPPGVVWLGLHALLGGDVACPRILAQYKRDEGPEG